MKGVFLGDMHLIKKENDNSNDIFTLLTLYGLIRPFVFDLYNKVPQRFSCHFTPPGKRAALLIWSRF